jgi:hypothetical protein
MSKSRLNQDKFPLFVKCYAITNWLMRATTHFPKVQRFTLVQRIDDLALDLLLLVPKALQSESRVPILDELDLRLDQLRVLLRLSFDQRHINVHKYEFIMKELNEAGRMVGGWKKAVA